MDVLSHIRVVDFTTNIAGPYATKLFVDAGAEVIKVEPVGGDPARRLTATGADLGGRDGALFHYLNAGKQSIVGTLEQPHIDALLAGADLVCEDLGPSHFDSHELRRRYPHLVVLSITPFGSTGPYADRVATEFTVQAESGSILYRGRPTKPPVQAGGRVTEYLSGAYGAPAALAAVLRARRTGIGEHVDVSMIEVMSIAASTFADLSHHLAGRPPLETAARGLETPSIEQAKDGFVGFNTNTAQMFQNFLIMIERPDLLDDADLATFGGRQRRAEWPTIMSEWMLEHTVDEIVEQASALRIPVAPVYDGQSIVTNEQLAFRGVFVENPGGFRQPRPPYRVDNAPAPAPRSAPRLDEHREVVLPRPAPIPTQLGADPRALPLVGLRVLDLTSWWAGPSSTHLLALLGAEVIHVESTGHPDGMRLTGYMFGREKWWEWGHMFAAANTNKLGITLDVSKPAGHDICVKLIEAADVVVENFAPRVMEQWGFDADAVMAINPRIIFTRMPAFGLTGPWRERVGFAQTMEQMTMASITGYAEDPPLIPRGPCDPNAGMHAAFAMLVALAKRDQTGKGVFIESTMVEAALNICPQPVIEYTAYGRVMQRMGNRSPYAAPQGVYAASGFESWLAISIETDTQWQALVDYLGTPAWAMEGSLATHEGRVVAHDMIDAELRSWAASLDAGSVADALVARGVPAARCVDPRVQSTHPQICARRFYETVEHPELGPHPVPGLPFRYATVTHWLHRATPTLGQDNADVLCRLAGLDASQLAVLEADGIVGTRPRGR